MSKSDNEDYSCLLWMIFAALVFIFCKLSDILNALEALK